MPRVIKYGPENFKTKSKDKEQGFWWAVVAHACNPSTLGGRGRQISEFEASLVYRVSSRTARAIQRNPVSRKANLKKPRTRWI